MEEAFNIPRLEIAGLEIFSFGVPTCIDGKERCYWSDLDAAMCDCPVCGATPEQMALVWCETFNHNPPSRLQFGISPLHCEGQIFRWLKKGTLYRDFQSHECRGVDNKMSKDIREVELEDNFETPTELRPRL